MLDDDAIRRPPDDRQPCITPAAPSCITPAHMSLLPQSDAIFDPVLPKLPNDVLGRIWISLDAETVRLIYLEYYAASTREFIDMVAGTISLKNDKNVVISYEKYMAAQMAVQRLYNWFVIVFAGNGRSDNERMPRYDWNLHLQRAWCMVYLGTPRKSLAYDYITLTPTSIFVHAVFNAKWEFLRDSLIYLAKLPNAPRVMLFRVITSPQQDPSLLMYRTPMSRDNLRISCGIMGHHFAELINKMPADVQIYVHAAPSWPSSVPADILYHYDIEDKDAYTRFMMGWAGVTTTRRADYLS